MSMPPLRLLQVGCGGMAAYALRSASASTEVQIVGLADLQISAAEKRRDEFAPKAVIGTDAAAMIQDLRPDLVFNCTVPGAHHAVSAAALAAGAHVLSEKPLAASLEEGRDLVRRAQEAGRLLAVTQNYRYSKAPRAVRAALESGMIGDVTALHCDFFIGAHFGGFRDEMEHVLLLDMSIHHFDLARYLSGCDPEWVSCQEWNPAGSWYRHGANAVALFSLGAGRFFSYRGSWCAEGMHTSWSGNWRIVGTRGTLIWDDAGIRTECATPRGGFHRETVAASVTAKACPGRDDGHASVFAEFVRCIREGAVPETVASDNVRSLAMVFSAIESASRGSAVAC